MAGPIDPPEESRITPDECLPDSCRPTRVRDIVPEALAAPFIVCHERATEFDRLTRKLGIQIEVSQELRDFQALASMHSKRLTIGLGLLERLWAYCYSYCVISKLTEEQLAFGRQIRLDESEESLKAVALLQWALRHDVVNEHTDWPVDLPAPVELHRSNGINLLATRVFLAAIAWIQLHEVGHIALEHAGSATLVGDDLVRQERDADRWASNWMLRDSAKLDHSEFAIRTGGIALALGVMASFEVYRREGARRMHLDPPDRFLEFLTEFVPSGESVAPNRTWAWWLAIHILKPHFDQQGLQIEEIVYDGPDDVVREVLFRLKRHRTQ